jgi:hypothetical protein
MGPLRASSIEDVAQPGIAALTARAFTAVVVEVGIGNVGLRAR